MVASVIVLALTATSCSTGSSRPRVVMIGNSITLLARPVRLGHSQTSTRTASDRPIWPSIAAMGFRCPARRRRT